MWHVCKHEITVLSATHRQTIHAFTPPPARRHYPLAGTHCAYPRRLSWPGWLVTYRDKCPAPDTVTHSSTSRARCRLTSLIDTSALPLVYRGSIAFLTAALKLVFLLFWFESLTSGVNVGLCHLISVIFAIYLEMDLSVISVTVLRCLDVRRCSNPYRHRISVTLLHCLRSRARYSLLIMMNVFTCELALCSAWSCLSNSHMGVSQYRL